MALVKTTHEIPTPPKSDLHLPVDLASSKLVGDQSPILKEWRACTNVFSLLTILKKSASF